MVTLVSKGLTDEQKSSFSFHYGEKVVMDEHIWVLNPAEDYCGEAGDNIAVEYRVNYLGIDRELTQQLLDELYEEKGITHIDYVCLSSDINNLHDITVVSWDKGRWDNITI